MLTSPILATRLPWAPGISYINRKGKGCVRWRNYHALCRTKIDLILRYFLDESKIFHCGSNPLNVDSPILATRLPGTPGISYINLKGKGRERWLNYYALVRTKIDLISSYFLYFAHFVSCSLCTFLELWFSSFWQAKDSPMSLYSNVTGAIFDLRDSIGFCCTIPRER